MHNWTSFVFEWVHFYETKKKIGDSQRGEKSYWDGKKFDDNRKRQMSESRKGIEFSDQHKIKLSESKMGSNNPMYGKNNTDEMKKMNSEANGGDKNANAKIVLNTETGIYYGCAKEAWDSFKRQSFEYFKFKLQGKKFINNTPFIYV